MSVFVTSENRSNFYYPCKVKQFISDFSKEVNWLHLSKFFSTVKKQTREKSYCS